MHGLPVINGDCGLTWKNAVFNSIPVFPTKSLHGKAIQDNDSYVLQENDADEFTNQSIRSQILPGIALGNDVESREGSFTVQILAVLVCCVHKSHSAIMTELIRIQRIHGCFLI